MVVNLALPSGSPVATVPARRSLKGIVRRIDVFAAAALRLQAARSRRRGDSIRTDRLVLAFIDRIRRLISSEHQEWVLLSFYVLTVA